MEKNILLKESYLSSIEEYVKEALDMKTIKLHLKDSKDVKRISKYGYEDLGDVDEEIVLLKDTEDEIVKEKRVRR